MSFENLSNTFADLLNLPDFEVRSVYLILMLLFFILSLEIHSLSESKFTLKIFVASIFLLALIVMNILPFIFSESLIAKFAFQNTFGLQIPIYILFVSQILSLILRRSTVALKPLRLFSFGLFSLYFLLVILASLFSRPYIILNNVMKGDIVNEAEKIEVRLTIPVKKESLNIFLSPSQELTINYDYVWISKEWIDGFQIIPAESYPAESRIVIYTTGLSNIFPGGASHEQSLEFFTSPLPDVRGTNLDEVKGAYSVDKDLELFLSDQDGEFVYWDVQVNPSVKYTTVREYSDRLIIDFDSLEQGTTYLVKISQANRIYSTNTHEQLRIGDLQLVREIIFKTADAPGIEGHNRSGSSLPNTEPWIIEFSEEIDLNSLSSSYSLSPAIEHDLDIGENKKSLIITPKHGFKKGTEYSITFKKGLRTLFGGYLEKDAIIKFKTPGIVYPTGYYPRNGSGDISRSVKSFAVTFDQPVNKESAQSKFTISPFVSGTFSWKNNTMYYSFNSALQYYKKYTVTIGSGVKSIYGYDSTRSYSSSFTTEEQIFILNVPQYYQPKGFDCNLYATKMALAYRGISISVEEMRSTLGIGQDPNMNWVTGYGVHWGPVSSYISRYRNNAVKSGWNLLSLLAEVNKGNPVILFWYNGYTTPTGAKTLEGGFTGYGGMHSEVVVGYTGRVDNPTSVILNDPWRGRRYLSLGTFNGLWSYLGYKAIVVY